MDVINGVGTPVRSLTNRPYLHPRRIGLAGLLAAATSLITGLGPIAPSLAQEVGAPSSRTPIMERLLDTEQTPVIINSQQLNALGDQAITQDTISETSLTLPSLWWSRDQIVAAVGDLPQFIDVWVAFRGSEEQPRRVDVVVNPQIWNLLNYLERYAVLNQFGSAAKSFGYSTRFFRGLDLTGAYICDFSQYPGLETDPAPTLSNLSEEALKEALKRIDCMIELDYRGRGSIRGNPSPGGP